MRAPSPIIRVQSSSPRPKKVRHRRRRGGGSSSLSGKTMLGAAIGGAIFGFVEKTFPALPTVPILGRAGTIALGCYLLGRNSRMGGGIVRLSLIHI